MLPIQILRCFSLKNVEYEILGHKPSDSLIDAARELRIDPGRVAVANILEDGHGMLMTIYPLNGQLDLATLNEKLGRRLRPVSYEKFHPEWPVYDKRQCVPLALMYKTGAEIYDRFATSQPVYIPIDNRTFCRISGADFCRLQGPAMYDDFFVKMPAETNTTVRNPAYQPGRKAAIRQKLKSLDSLPAMPTMAQQLLKLNANPYGGASDLASIVEQDPSLSAQLIRYARSPLYGYAGKIESIQDAISRVLGYDMVMDMAMGVAVGKMFRNPKDGKLGLHEHWRQATYNAVLCQKLCKVVKGPERARPGIAYLAGLLHNFGFLLLGHLFPQDFAMLNKAATRYPDTSVTELEHTMIGVTHMELGVWLMEAWQMPEEIVTAIREHHNEQYCNQYSLYANLVMVANRLLREVDIGDELVSDLPDGILTRHKLDPVQVHAIFEEVIGAGQGLDYLAEEMAA